jgi:adenylate kinase family enzyme
MQRVLVIGCSGAGKSRFSRRLAGITGLPRTELDQAFWRPGWQPTPRAQWLARVGELCAAPRWILDGNFHGSLHIRVPRSDTVIWLDYPRDLCIRRVFGRILHNYGQVRNGLPAGCPEKFDLAFLRYIWNFNADHGPRLEAALAEHGGHVRLYRLKSDSEAERLLAELSAKSAAIQHQPPRSP